MQHTLFLYRGFVPSLKQQLSRAIQERNALTAGTGCTGCKGGSGNTLGDSFFHSPENGLIVGAALYIRKGILVRRRLRTACCPPKEGYNLSASAGLARQKMGVVIAVGDAIFYSPKDSIVAVGGGVLDVNEGGSGWVFRGSNEKLPR
jgi:hypothetical protein